jgi:hypothetical protein
MDYFTTRVIAFKCTDNGELNVIADTNESFPQNLSTAPKETKKVGLSPFFSISIAGCDLMGSCLYTAGVCTFNSGKV